MLILLDWISPTNEIISTDFFEIDTSVGVDNENGSSFQEIFEEYDGGSNNDIPANKGKTNDLSYKRNFLVQFLLVRVSI